MRPQRGYALSINGMNPGMEIIPVARISAISAYIMNKIQKYITNENHK